MKAQFLIHNEAIANNVGVAIRNNWQSNGKAKGQCPQQTKMR